MTSSDTNPSPLGEASHARTLREWFSGRPLGRATHLLLGLVLPMIVGLVTMARLRSFTIDDAYISYRYARNLASGAGLVYNAGERIEGYTNFSWTLILALGAKLGVDPTVGAKVLGFACGLTSIALVFLLESRLRPLRVVPALAPWLLASTTAFMGYAVFGLETAFFVALVLGGLILVMREDDLGGLPWSGVVFGVAGLTRPEAPLFLGLAMLFLGGPALVRGIPARSRPLVMTGGLVALSVALLGKLRSPDPSTLTQLGSWALAAVGAVAIGAALPRRLFEVRNLARGAIFLAMVAAHLAWRKSYYGEWIPNTFAAKTGDLHLQLAGGFEYLKRYAAHEGPLTALMVLGFGAALGRRDRWPLALAATSACVLAYIAIVGGDWMPMHRFATSLQPFLYLLVGVGLRDLVEERHPALNGGLALLGALVLWSRTGQLDEDRRKILLEEKAFWDRAAGGVGVWFRTLEADRGREAVEGTIALGDIGQVGYETGLPVLDLLGLIDPVIARLPGGYTRKIGPGFRDYFFSRRPRYFLLISSNHDCEHPSVTGSIAIHRDPRFRPAYSVSGRVMLSGGFSWCLYENNDWLDLTTDVVVVDGERTLKVPRDRFGRAARPLDTNPPTEKEEPPAFAPPGLGAPVPDSSVPSPAP